MATRHVNALLALIICVNLINCAGENNLANNESSRGSLVIIQASDALSLDPHMYNEDVTLSVNGNIFEGLISLDKNLKIDPSISLAESWINPDDTTWIFYLRKGIKFHDGTKLKASDVKFSLDRAKDHPGSQMSGNVASIASVRSIDDFTIEIKTTKPCGILPYKINDVFILSERYVREKGDQHISMHPVGTGPYKFVEWEKGRYVKLEAFDEYWQGKPEIRNVVIKSVSDTEKRLAALLESEADIVVDIPVDEVARVKNNEKVRLITRNSLRVIYLAFDVDRSKTPFINLDHNPLRDKRVRLAVYYGIDEDGIIENIMRGYATLASQFSSPYVFGFNPDVKRSPYRPLKARSLLKEAGYENGFEITLHAPNNRYVNDEAIGEAVVRNLNEIGIKAKLQALPKEEFIPGYADRKYSFSLVGWSCPNGEASSVFEDCIHTRERGYGSYNGMGYSNRELDKIIEAIPATIDPDRRLSLIQNAQKIGMDDVVWVPLHCQVDIYGVSNDISFDPRLDKRLKAFEVGLKKLKSRKKDENGKTAEIESHKATMW